MSTDTLLQQAKQQMADADKMLEKIVVELAHAVAQEDDERIDVAVRDLHNLQDHRRTLYDNLQRLKALRRRASR